MKKRTLLLSVFTLIFLSSFILALEVCEDGDSDCQINNGYSCLSEKIDTRGCDSLSEGEKIFSALASGDCKSEVAADLDSGYTGSNSIKLTAQAVLALGGDLEGEEWLMEQKGTPSEINWFLQIESNDATTCTITYDNNDRSVSIGEDKKFNTNAGTCLTLAAGGYWLKVNSACYDEIFEVSCDQSFLTSLLYQEQNLNTIYVVEGTHGADANAITSEQVNSSCFKQGNSCDYEGSLWAAMVLDSFDYEISEYMPYLITLEDKEANKKFLPEAFLYLLTNDFFPELLDLQKSGKWWAESNDKFYDTALALYALQYDEPPQKENAVNWLFESQDSDGCWNNGNLRNTAFILYSLQPRSAGANGGAGDTVSCQSAGYYCMSSISCNEAGGEEIEDYSCSGTYECCSEPKLLESCLDQGGDVCNSDQICSGGTELDASGLDTDQTCCFGGSCQVPSESVSECEDFGYECRYTGCQEGEEQISSECEYRSDYCCKPTTGGGGIGMVWIMTLFILIVLAVVGIIYKDKLRKIWFRLKDKFMPSKGRPGRRPGPGPRRPPFPPRASVGRRQLPRRVIPAPIQAPNPRMMANVRPRKDVDDVLKKLKEMGK